MDFQKAVELINESENILITTHTRPDGDACGSIAALAETLESIGKDIEILFLSPVPQWYRFLFEKNIKIIGENIKTEQLTTGEFAEPDVIIIIDTNSKSQLPGFTDYLKENDKPVLVFDHHLTSDNLGSVEIVDTTAAAAGLIILDLLKFAGWKVTKKIATALFVAVSTDTGWFQFNNTDSRALRACAELIEAGVDSTQIYHDLYQNFSQARFKLMLVMLNTLEFHFDGRYATQHLSLDDFKHTGAQFSDTENLIDECRRLNSVEAAAFFVELADGRIKCSLRSRGAIDVRKIAQKFGGGGHKMASGTHLPGPFKNAQKLIFEQIAEQFGKIDSK